jgi:Domain of unknown function (DUF4411)
MAAITYWIDADVLIQAKNGPYAFSVVPNFWIFIIKQFQRGVLNCPKIVYDELIDGNDELAKWCKIREGDICRPSLRPEQKHLNAIADHVVSKYKSHQAAEFMRGGDAWVIAHALQANGMVVTQESPRSRRSKIKIPTICTAFEVPYVNTYEMLKKLGAKL